MFNVLIVEDIEATSSWIENLVRQAFPDVKTVVCHDIQTTKATLNTHSFALALVDLNLPDGSGLDLIPLMRQQHPNICTVIMTIFDDADHIFSAIQQGAMGYLLKDQPEKILIAKLRSAMNGEPPLSPAIARKILEHVRKAPTEQQAQTQNNVHFHLKTREKEILTFIAKGLNRTEIAEMIALSPHTVAGYIKNIYQKLDVNSRAEAAIMASRIGLV